MRRRHHLGFDVQHEFVAKKLELLKPLWRHQEPGAITNIREEEKTGDASSNVERRCAKVAAAAARFTVRGLRIRSRGIGMRLKSARAVRNDR